MMEAVLRLAVPREPIHRYGWYPPINQTVTISRQDTDGHFRSVNVTYSYHGFKRWGDPDTNKTKVFIMGDSFTEMSFVNNGEEYYAYLEDAFDVELFVFGAGGYGTLQEYMVYKDYLDIIDPDVIIWQFYFNDFINNVFEFDRREYPLNSLSFRPFLEGQSIVYRFPAPLGWLRSRSRTMDIALGLHDRVRRSIAARDDVFYHKVYGKNFWDKDFTEAEIFDNQFDEAFQTTYRILAAAKRQAEDRPFYMFGVDEKLTQHEERLCGLTNITFIGRVDDILKLREAEGVQVQITGDRHWNREGNRVVGEFLVSYFREGKVFS